MPRWGGNAVIVLIFMIGIAALAMAFLALRGI
jgi:hypothetical protein